VTGAKVEEIDQHGVLAGGDRIASATVLWTAGVAPAPILTMLGCETDRAGHPFVSPLLSVPNQPGVFVVGDAAAVVHGDHALPGVAQVAIQQRAYVGRLIRAEIQGGPLIGPFRSSDKGTMAVVGANFWCGFGRCSFPRLGSTPIAAFTVNLGMGDRRWRWRRPQYAPSLSHEVAG
jgi:NADH dehydrogenase